MGALPLASQPSGLNKLPELEWENGTKVSKKAKAWIISTLRMENMETRSEIWPEVRERLDDESCYALADTWVEDTPKEARWGVSGRYTGNMLFVQCMLGKPEHIRDILANLDTLASSQSTQWGSEGVEALTRDGSDLAIRGLDRASKKSRRQALKWRAASGLNTLARRRDMTLEELLDSAVSDFGFDASGEQVLDYGPRTITVRLGPSNELVIIDEKGKTLKSMPKARKSDDAALVDVARKHVSSIKKQIKEIHTSQLRRLDDALSSQREWPVAAWEKRFLHHPLMHAFSRQLIWEALGPDQKEVAAFLVTEEGEPVDVEAEAIELPQGGSIRLLHPVSLKKKQSDAWKEMFADLELTQPIPQLERRVYKAKELPKKDKDLFQSFPMCTAGQFMGRLDKFGFERGPREDAGAITSSYKTYGPYSITLGHSWYMPELPGEDNMEIEGISASKGDDAVAWRKLPPIILSELVRDLHLLMGG